MNIHLTKQYPFAIPKHISLQQHYLFLYILKNFIIFASQTILLDFNSNAKESLQSKLTNIPFSDFFKRLVQLNLLVQLDLTSLLPPLLRPVKIN